MKRLLGVFLAIACLMGVLAGCGSNKSGLDSKNPITVTLWHYYDGDLRISLDAQVEEFNQTVGISSGVLVEAVSLGTINDLEDALTQSSEGVVGSADMPDMFFSYADKALEIMKNTDLVDLNDYFTTEELGEYVQSFLGDGDLDGKQIVLPVVKSTELLFLNGTDFSAFAGETGHTAADLSTWEGLYQTAAEYYEWSGGQPLFGIDNTANYIIIASRQLGLEVLYGDGTGEGHVNLDEAVLRRVFDTYFNGYTLGYYASVGSYRSDDVKSGELVGFVGSSSGASFFPTEVAKGNSVYPIEFEATAYPTFADGERYAVQQGAGICMAATGDAQQEGSALFLKWLTGTEPNVEFSLATGYLPVRVDSYTSDELQAGLEALRGGSDADNIAAAVYEVSSEAMLNGKSYAITPFDGSYGARYALVDPLEELTAEAQVEAAALRGDGMDDDAILGALGDSYFARWIEAIKDDLDRRGVAYQ